MSLFGEMFKPETATYAFDSVDGCQGSDRIITVPDGTINLRGAEFVYYTTNKKEFKIGNVEETHPFYGMEWYRPNHLFHDDDPDAKPPNIVIVGLLSLHSFSEKLDNLSDNNFNVVDDLTEAKLRLYGLPKDFIDTDKSPLQVNESYAHNCMDTSTDTSVCVDKLFIPSENQAYNDGFPRCPERVSPNKLEI